MQGGVGWETNRVGLNTSTDGVIVFGALEAGDPLPHAIHVSATVFSSPISLISHVF